MQKNLIILRGLPGSGKSSVASLFSGVTLEADQYFIDPLTREYQFSPEKLEKAHKWCQHQCELNMQAGEKTIVIANTNTTKKEWEPYVALAEKYNYKVFYLIVENRHGHNDIHNCPTDVKKRMKMRFEIQL